MEVKYKLSCGAYLSEYIKNEKVNGLSLKGWYHYIDNPEFNTVGVVATAEILILIKKCEINVEFDCEPMVKSLLSLQNRDGGWSFKSNFLKSAVEPTARSVQALLLWDELLDSSQKQALKRGIYWLLKYRNKRCLWGPINKKEKESYVYFSCVVLQCFKEILGLNKKYISKSTKDNIFCILDESAITLLNCFNDNDTQCGWGITDAKEPTLFHTAYTVYTLLTIDHNYINKHAIRKSIEFLKDRFLNTEEHKYSHYNYNVGESEIYQYRKLRLVYTHSVDVYMVLALLQDASNATVEQIINKCKYFISCAEKTDWRYRDYKTCWRLFDIILLCDFYTNLQKGDTIEKMKHFKVAFTFAGESRDLVKKIADEVSKFFDRSEILYDEYHKADFARPQLDLYLQKLYHDCSDLIVVFLCENYEQKRWCGVEWRAVRDILNNFKYDRIMYVKATDKDINDVNIPGFYPSEDGFIDANKQTPEEIADMIFERHKSI